MSKKGKNEELLSRRGFFKKSAKAALPILGISLFGTAILTSCEKEDDDDDNSGGCNRNSCSGSCSGYCSGSCSGFCDGTCAGTSK